MTRHRPRIVKPHSAKQRANAKRYSAGSGRFVIQPKDTGLPQYSWWAYDPPQDWVHGDRGVAGASDAVVEVRIVAESDRR